MRILPMIMVTSGRRFKRIAGLGIWVFIILGTYTMGMERYGALTPLVGLFLWCSLAIIMYLVPFGLALGPVMFELWLRDITLWEVSTLAWMMTCIMFIAHGMTGLGYYLDHKNIG